MDTIISLIANTIVVCVVVLFLYHTDKYEPKSERLKAIIGGCFGFFGTIMTISGVLALIIENFPSSAFYLLVGIPLLIIGMFLYNETKNSTNLAGKTAIILFVSTMIVSMFL